MIPVTTAQGEELSKQIGATYYIECSSKTQQNVKAVFDAAIKVVIQPATKKEKRRRRNKTRMLCNEHLLWKERVVLQILNVQRGCLHETISWVPRPCTMAGTTTSSSSLHQYRHAAKWTFFFDIDEYIFLPDGRVLEESSITM